VRREQKEGPRCDRDPVDDVVRREETAGEHEARGDEDHRVRRSGREPWCSASVTTMSRVAQTQPTVG